MNHCGFLNMATLKTPRLQPAPLWSPDTWAPAQPISTPAHPAGLLPPSRLLRIQAQARRTYEGKVLPPLVQHLPPRPHRPALGASTATRQEETEHAEVSLTLLSTQSLFPKLNPEKKKHNKLTVTTLTMLTIHGEKDGFIRAVRADWELMGLIRATSAEKPGAASARGFDRRRGPQADPQGTGCLQVSSSRVPWLQAEGTR